MSLLAFWSPKGGSGTSVAAAACAVHAAGGPVPPGSSICGAISPRCSDSAPTPRPASPTGSPGADGAHRRARPAGCRGRPGLSLLPRGRLAGVLEPEAAAEAGAALAVALRDGPLTIVDVGVPDSPVARAVLEISDATLLVVRERYLALRRAAAPRSPPGRSGSSSCRSRAARSGRPTSRRSSAVRSPPGSPCAWRSPGGRRRRAPHAAAGAVGALGRADPAALGLARGRAAA